MQFLRIIRYLGLILLIVIVNIYGSEHNSEQMLNKYGWTISKKVNAYSVKLPPDRIHDPGEFPLKLYWAYNLELSKSIGLDFYEFFGQES